MRAIAICGAVGILALCVHAFLYDAASCDEDVYTRFVTIEGNVSIFEPETRKTFTKARQHLIFQRDDCKKCLVMAFTDSDGHYSMRVGEGKYRVVLREDLSKGGSTLDPSQPDVIDARNKLRSNRFDVKLIRHKNPNDIDLTLPR